jgi:hypothetical protein
VTLLAALQGDVSRAPEDVRRTVAEHGIRTWLYAGEDGGWRVGAERRELAELEPLPLGEHVERFAWTLRRAYIDWIGELSLVNDSLEWWASELAAKNPFMLLYNRLCALAAARELMAGGLHSALVVCSSPALVDGVIGVANELGIEAMPVAGGRGARPDAPRRRARMERRLVELWARRAPSVAHSLPGLVSDAARRGLDSSPAYRRRLLERLGAQRAGGFAGEGTSLLFTWVDARSLTEGGGYRDPHFGSLPRLLRDAGQRVAYVPHFLPGSSVEPVARGMLATDETMFFPDLFVDDAGLADCRARADAFAPAIEPDAEVGGIPVASLAGEQVESFRWIQAMALAYERVIRGLVAAGVRPERVFLPYEGHSWEQVVCWAYRRHSPETRVIGYENVNFSRLALSMYPAGSEFGRRPLPDRLVTNGETFRNVLEDEGFPRESIRVGCALRHEYLWNGAGGPSVDRGPGPATRVLVAASIDVGQSVELIEAALAAFGGSEGFQVIVKLHPAVDDRTVLALLGPGVQAANVEFASTAIPELLSQADVLLYKYTVVCYEALAHGVPCVFVKSETGLDLDQLEPFPELRRAARSTAELRAAVTELTSMTEAERATWEERAREAVRASLAPVSAACAAPFLS